MNTSEITGYTEGEFRIPLFAPAPKNTLPEPRYRGKSMTADELDEECTRVHEANERYRKYGF